ncbi:glycosyltransferase family 2 protein [Metabacillus halosaccharovorans]|uniref:glycosyltransferase family 2 protein n=1 Tax=Metabacillus halosaccharovorans TaxID=930124 RepID=UPI001C1F49D8|nr:glycosyltransferase family 2 protein [Metabacillus halosaccharovorans]MBU7594570.1 glycosyltransferase family 2 protein [Metabacillus halosaccharovorans]
MKISLAMIVKNGERTIDRCLQSVQSLVDEIVVVDTGSSDNTIDILKGNSNIKMLHFEWCDDFSLARNYAIDNTSGDYILVLDSDEYIIEGKRSELERIAERNLIGRFKILNNFIKENQTLQSISHVSRFFPKTVRYVGCVHEQLDTILPRVGMNITVEHDGYIKGDKSKRNIPLLIKNLKQYPSDPYYLFQLGKELRIDKQYQQAFSILMKSYKMSAYNTAFYDKLILEIIYSGKEIGKVEVLNIIEHNEGKLENVTDFHFAKGMFFLDFLVKHPSTKLVKMEMIKDSFLTCLALSEKKHTEYVRGTSSFLANFNLGLYYELTGDLNRSIDFYKLSALEGYLDAQKRLSNILSRMSSNQE